MQCPETVDETTDNYTRMVSSPTILWLHSSSFAKPGLNLNYRPACQCNYAQAGLWTSGGLLPLLYFSYSPVS